MNYLEVQMISGQVTRAHAIHSTLTPVQTHHAHPTLYSLSLSSLTRASLAPPSPARSLALPHVTQDVLEVALTYPKTHALIKRRALRMAMRRQFILAAKVILAQEGKEFGAGRKGRLDSILERATAVPMSEVTDYSSHFTHSLTHTPPMHPSPSPLSL